MAASTKSFKIEISCVNSGVTGSKSGQVSFQDFQAQTLASNMKKIDNDLSMKYKLDITFHYEIQKVWFSFLPL